jgi:hypothetical protein
LNLRLLTRRFGWLTLAGLLAVTATARAGGGPDELQQVVDGYTVTLAVAAVPARTGSNNLIVTIYDASGAPVDDATVTAAVLTYAAADDGHADTHSQGSPNESHAQDSQGDEHEASPAHADGDTHAEGSANESHGDDHSGNGLGHGAIPTILERAEAGVYRAPLFLDQVGTATVAVVFTLRETARTALFHVAVVQARPRALVLGGFAAVNALVIVTAAILKRRMPQKRGGRVAPTREMSNSIIAVPASAQEDRPA